MKQKIFILAGLIAATMLLAGCFSGGGSSGSGSASGGGGVEVAGLPGGDGAGDGVGGGILGGGDGGEFGHTPEPATIALVGGGFAAYVLLRRKKRNKL